MPGSGLDKESISGPETLTQTHEIGLEVNCLWAQHLQLEIFGKSHIGTDSFLAFL